MSLDGIFLHSIHNELNNKLLGARVDKIYQPDKNEIIISLRNSGENYKLLLTAASSSPRIHLTDVTRKNPEQPPMFCMLLRKHLTGAHITEVSQINMDRILEISFECKDELDTTVHKSLIIEIMGKHSNIIFINKNSRIIIDSIKRVAENVSSVRQVYPGLVYVTPPADKTNPLETDKEKFYEEVSSSFKGMYVYDFFYKNFLGMSPFISKEICFLAKINESTYMGEVSELQKERLWAAFDSVFEKTKKGEYTFNVFFDEKKQLFDFYCLDVEYLNSMDKKNYASPGNMLDDYYFEQDNKNKINQKVSSLLKSLNTKIDRDKKKVEKQRNELLNAEDRDKYRVYGELIIANLHMTPENHKLKVVNYYDPEMKEITIPLDPKLNLNQNSQKFFKRYNKLKNAEEELQKFIETSLSEIKYLENILYSIESCETTEDLDDIYTELIAEGFMKKKGKIKKSKEYKTEFTTYVSSKGHEIIVGKNNIQNDMLTFKIGKKEDYWFHAKDMPGSHVIIKTNGDELEDDEYVEAAKVAAFYSKGKNSGFVEVDYTKKSNVKKPAGAKPGFVIYDTNYSMLVEPDISGINLKQ
ncbi:NFACT family protein [Sedimentibacter sp. B4]|uniref:Rqc2 family fibronectin-binding protein n=1 Tax=Sedimentibacter sp. B4 TaxID=304766 RepID=UPI00031FA302|nr:NFACT RNA binding domain-containing protein [Sedimentibacter sp. B4]